jgi:ABC-2 type transport system ATP-binding protein
MRIELRGVTKCFGDVVALHDLSLAIASGAKVGLVGPNGSGKSTLIRVLMGILRAEGHVRLDDLDPLTARGALAPKIAYVPQIAPHLAAPVRDVVRAIADVRRVERSEVEATAERLDLDLRGVADRPFRGLSGGMRHKLLIALALASPTSLLVLDEPTASLDADARERFFRLCAEETGLSTLLLCSHRIDEMRHLVDHVVALHEGRLAYDGSATEYLEKRAVSVLQVCVTGADAQSWVRVRGFSPGAGGWWTRTVTHDEKLSLLPEISGRLQSGIRDVQIQEIDRVEAGAAHD